MPMTSETIEEREEKENSGFMHQKKLFKVSNSKYRFEADS
jgi:hypothetical protein